MLALLLGSAALAAPAVEARDDKGRQLRLARPALRVVSLSPHATELLYAIGAGSTLVGRDGASDEPAAARALPDVGRYGAFNVEAIVALRPDLVVAWEGSEAGPALTRLHELGLPLFASQPADIAAIAGTVRALGRLTGRTEAEALARRFESEWAALKARYANSRPLTVVVQVGEGPALTVNDRQFTASLLRVCGVVNPFGASSAPVPVIGAEALLAARPDAMVAVADAAEAAVWRANWRSRGLDVPWLTVDPRRFGRPVPAAVKEAEALCRRLDSLRRRPS
ncbi:helical backbone metal receptor [Chitinimonas lacunae]|uniref:Helical backbone metal receptor n=1 Tax=Chitinimonas lacunae TaxID=1963018 RepID=A0ABV8MUA6_9NEIS